MAGKIVIPTAIAQMNNQDLGMGRDMQRQLAGYGPVTEDSDDAGQDLLFDIEGEVRACDQVLVATYYI